MMLERILRYRILVPIILFYFVMSVLTPLTHDDLEWATSYGTEMFHTFYETLNGRYLGNTFEVIATRIPFFRYVIYVLFSIGILLIIQKSVDDILGKDRHPNYHLLVLFTLILCIPATIYSQIYGWFAGFYNYVPATFASLVILRYCIKLMYYKKLLWWEMVILMITALMGQWFMESMTLFNVAIIMIAAVIYYVKYRKHLKQLLIALSSAVIGAIIMFINPQYVKIFSGQSDYQKVGNKEEGLFHRILKTFLTQFPEHIIYQSILILLIISVLLGILLYHSDVALAIKGSLFVGLASAPIYTFFIRMPLNLDTKLNEIPTALLDFTVAFLYYSVLIVTMCYISLPIRIKTYLVLLIITIPIMVAPLLIVQPIGPRNFYSVFIIFVMVAFLLFRYIAFQGSQWQWLIKIFAVTFASAYVIMFLIIAISDHTRIAKIHHAATENPKVKTYYMKRLPFEDYMQRSSPETERRKRIFKDYYEIPQHIKIIFPPKEDKRR
ncbi:DUF6056 family protein [Staphylococcus agnetis]|uniref:DUF6056 family protein n=1 Tax=Staphylococcus agnetis TaxID=985762 RepID=UPI000D1A7F9C|nr:DUF6056 family protein [Staphylococcus agnetis]PTH59410.1 hypothetical protein BU584_01360 [Staphylococcus agnetis]